MNEATFPQRWKTLYAAAMLECDDTQLRQRIDTADPVIRDRLRQLPPEYSLDSEQEELQFALDYLRLLRNALRVDLR